MELCRPTMTASCNLPLPHCFFILDSLDCLTRLIRLARSPPKHATAPSTATETPTTTARATERSGARGGGAKQTPELHSHKGCAVGHKTKRAESKSETWARKLQLQPKIQNTSSFKFHPKSKLKIARCVDQQLSFSPLQRAAVHCLRMPMPPWHWYPDVLPPNPPAPAAILLPTLPPPFPPQRFSHDPTKPMEHRRASNPRSSQRLHLPLLHRLPRRSTRPPLVVTMRLIRIAVRCLTLSTTGLSIVPVSSRIVTSITEQHQEQVTPTSHN